MNTAISLTVWTWVVLVSIVLILALYRVVITRGDYTVLHVRRSELSMIPQQIMHDRRLHLIDFWGRLLTIAAFIIGFGLAAVYLYEAATQATQY
jgi:hypothetical protein